MTVIDSTQIEKLREIVDGPAANIVIVTHTNPDGDALGSSIAWGRILTAKGHNVTCIVPNRPPSFLDWMPGIEHVRVFKNDTAGDLSGIIEKAEIIFCLDFNQISRLEGLGDTIAANKKAKFILIDHHLDPPTGYDMMFSYPTISSTSFLVYKLIESLEGTDAITCEMGEALYVGIMTDTGNFAFSFLTSDLFRAVATLVDKGLDIAYVHSKVYNSFTADRVRLLGYALNKMETLREGAVGVAYITLSEKELAKFNFRQGDSEGFVNYPLSIKKIHMSAMFTETRDFIRISFRSRADVNVSLFAQKYFAGGGHKNAAGGKSFVGMEETIAHFRKSLAEFFNHGNE